MPMQKESNIFRRLRVSVHLLFRRLRIPNSHFLDLLAIIVGIATALVAIIFLQGVDLVFWASNKLTTLFPDPRLMIFIPAIGGLMCGLTTFLFSPKAKGQGIPFVIYAVLMKSGLIELRNSVSRMLATIFTLGTMGSAGTEGPVVYFGSSVGSGFAQAFKLSPHNMKIMVSCGAAAGIAATFQAPIGGVMFALEAILHSFSPKVFSPIIIAAVVSSVTFKAIIGSHNAYLSNLIYEQQVIEVLAFAVLGVICGVLASVFIKIYFKFSLLIKSLKVHPVLKPALGGLLTGFVLLAAPNMAGNSYQLVERLVQGELIIWQLLLFYLVLKILATCFTLGSGGSGGLFAPSLVFGAIVGALFHNMLEFFLPQISVVGIYVMVGMAAFVSGTTHGPFAAILILCEMTGNYSVILPLLAGCVTAIISGRAIMDASIYTVPLQALGIHLRDGHDLDVLKTYQVRDLMETQILSVRHCDKIREVLAILHESPHDHALVRSEHDQIEGVISFYHLTPIILSQKDGLNKTAREAMHTTNDAVYEDDPILKAYDQFLMKETSYLLVIDRSKNYVGIIFKADIMRSYRKALHQKSLAMTH